MHLNQWWRRVYKYLGDGLELNLFDTITQEEKGKEANRWRRRGAARAGARVRGHRQMQLNQIWRRVHKCLGEGLELNKTCTWGDSGEGAAVCKHRQAQHNQNQRRVDAYCDSVLSRYCSWRWEEEDAGAGVCKHRQVQFNLLQRRVYAYLGSSIGFNHGRLNHFASTLRT